MKWISLNNHKEAVQEYHLMDDDESKVILKFNPQQKSARISCANQQRLFFIKNAGVLTGRYIFNNEYGVEKGSLSQDKKKIKRGKVIIEYKKNKYEITNNPLAELCIYDNDSNRSLIKCGLTVTGNKPGISFAKNAEHTDHNSFLLALCWFLFLPVAKENVIEYAA